jgi:hypothetical protein
LGFDVLVVFEGVEDVGFFEDLGLRGAGLEVVTGATFSAFARFCGLDGWLLLASTS